MGARARRLLVGLVGSLLVLPVVALTGHGTATAAPEAPGGEQPAAATGSSLTVPARYRNQTLHWRTCDFDAEVRNQTPQAPETDCTRIKVPMDWRHPDAHPDIWLAIALSHATGRSQGLLTLNPGGPGLPALDNPALFATGKPRLFAEYDLLGFDPRGYGQSQPASCSAATARWDALPVVADLRVRTAATHRAEVAAAKLEAATCSGAELSAFVGTQQTVDDLEFLRSYLSAHRPSSAAARAGYDRLNYVGYSYGTWLGAWYADSFPEHTGRFVLDSNMNWTASMYANQRTDSFSFQRRRDRMLFPWIARHAKRYGLGTTAAQVKRRYESTRAGVLRAYRAHRSPVTAEDLDSELLGLLYTDARFPEAAETLQTYADWAKPARGSVDGRQNGRWTSAGPDSLVRCNDTAYPRSVAPVLRRADSDARRYPFIGYWDTVGPCNYWPHPATPRTIDLAGAPRILMVQAEGDPATAYEGARAAHLATAAHTRLVSVDDEGQHGLYLTGVSPCVERIGDAFLFGGRLPAKDTTCQASKLPGDSRTYPFRGPLEGYAHTLNARVSPAPAPSAATPNRLVAGLQRRIAEQDTGARAPR